MSESNSEKTTPQDISSTGDQSDSQNDPTPSSAEAPANDERKATSTTEAANEKPFDPEDEFRAMFAPGPDGKPNRNQPDLQSLLAQLMGAGFGGAGASGAVTTSSQDDVTNLVTPGAMGAGPGSSSSSASQNAIGARSEEEAAALNVEFENKEEVAVDGSNSLLNKKVVCSYCKKSVILLSGAAEYVKKEIFLPYPRASSQKHGKTYEHFFKVTSKMSFENIGVRRASEEDQFRYLTCCDCDAGPLGITFNADRNNIFYICHDRVKYV